jgi:hypothetical protein
MMFGAHAHFGVLALSQLPVMSLELSSDLVSFRRTAILDDRLYDPAGVMLEHDDLYFSGHDGH